ncbi:response regulator [Novosphingobium album (ex Hu et al. 2023)]|uniref:Response regulator transcription factor n=1 Tax=Novosphingobium album (ex Hu et al. 2023) TaxID=2930093 RepID=A0ABT0B5W4_9SPHN|nr:response regulator transcription factor [Novosphingobium album (ex Hu et al. 2023)]MCJ2180194.1 response regulator transcription factor [Novosphingobium album (ex Hu et al. 2023)]
MDDHPLFRQALAGTVQLVAPDAQVELCEDFRTLRERLESHETVSLILLDLNLPDVDGIAGLPFLKGQYPHIPVAVVSARDDLEVVQTAIACGASGFISKVSGVPSLQAALDALLRGEEWFDGLEQLPDEDPLTPMQLRILNGVQRGLMNKQIAFEAGITEATVKYHLSNIFRKMGVQTRNQLLALTR